MYPVDVTKVHSYLEARPGDGYQVVQWFGLQAILKKYFEGPVVESWMIDEAEALCQQHFSRPLFNRKGWERIVKVHGGRLPLKIQAGAEGTVHDRGDVLMSIENTDPMLPWLTNAVESLLLHVWYPTTVATIGHDLKAFFKSNVPEGMHDFMLHDFGFRGVSSVESAEMGGMAHLVNFKGTDTLPAMQAAQRYYGASLEGLAFSVAASEHSIMTQYGQDGEESLIRHLMATHPNQILSLVADSYDYYQFVQKVVRNLDVAKQFKCQVVIRPDSPTPQHPDPADLINWTLINTPETVNVLWGDGLTPEQIKDIVLRVDAVDRKRLVFGMGGGLLQKVNRDTLRFAIKCSAVERDGQWQNVQKNPLDQTKKSKAGRVTPDTGCVVFENGVICQQETFEKIRQRAESVV
jgi:nicotinamide phosphoribosyltransferase